MQTKTKERGLFVLGLLICFSVAVASVLLERLIPGQLLGASLSVSTILFVGKMTFFVMIFTFAMCFGAWAYSRRRTKLMKKMIYWLLPIQILVLLLSPRFGWRMHNISAVDFTYQGTAYQNGALHCVYANQKDRVDISYRHPFSKKFIITVNDAQVYTMQVKADGESEESVPDMLPGIANDVVWNDTYGIFGWRCILAVALTLLSMKILRNAYGKAAEGKLRYGGAAAVYLFAVLVSLRIIF